MSTRLECQGHGSDLLRPHNIERPCSFNNVFTGAFLTADPKDDGHKDVDACGFGLCHSLLGLFRCQAFLYPPECNSNTLVLPKV